MKTFLMKYTQNCIVIYTKNCIQFNNILINIYTNQKHYEIYTCRLNLLNLIRLSSIKQVKRKTNLLIIWTKT